VQTDGQAVQVAALRDITKRKEWEQELVRAKNEAEEMARLKSNLLSNMSHELRTPITSITGYAELIMDEADGLHAEHAARIQKSGQRLFETLQSVLDMAQLEAGTLDIDPQPVDALEVVQEVVEVHKLAATKKSLSIHVDVSSDVILQTDRRFLRRILSNLVHNAVKFTDEGGLWIQGESSGEGVRLMVRDTGMGIDPEKQDQLFDAFRQGTEGRDRTHEGTGLGLALTKRMVEVLGGTIRVDSTKGEGSTFVVELPSLPMDGAAADLADRSVDRATGTGS
jgi:signal transduction histidine kinase